MFTAKGLVSMVSAVGNSRRSHRPVRPCQCPQFHRHGGTCAAPLSCPGDAMGICCNISRVYIYIYTHHEYMCICIYIYIHMYI